MTRAIAVKSIARQWRTHVCAIIEISLGQGIAQKRALLPHATMAQQWRKPSLARIPTHPLCAASALPSATLGGAPLNVWGMTSGRLGPAVVLVCRRRWGDRGGPAAGRLHSRAWAAARYPSVTLTQDRCWQGIDNARMSKRGHMINGHGGANAGVSPRFAWPRAPRHHPPAAAGSSPSPRLRSRACQTSPTFLRRRDVRYERCIETTMVGGPCAMLSARVLVEGGPALFPQCPGTIQITSRH